MKLSVVIPARNEEGNIEQTLIGLRDHLDHANITDFELLVVDDGSTDATNALVQALNAQDRRMMVIQNPGKHGFGRAVAYGLEHFSGDAVIIYMADASDAPEDVVKY